VDPVKLATVGRERGHQVRIKRNDSEYGLYTVSQVRQERPDNIVRMGSAGRERLGTSDEFVGSLDSQVPHPTFDGAEAEANNEFVERLEEHAYRPRGHRTSRGRHRAPYRPTGRARGVATRGKGG